MNAALVLNSGCFLLLFLSDRMLPPTSGGIDSCIRSFAFAVMIPPGTTKTMSERRAQFVPSVVAFAVPFVVAACLPFASRPMASAKRSWTSSTSVMKF